jgi:hypothetical protein
MLFDMIINLLRRRKIINTGMAGKCRNQKAPGALPRLFVRAPVPSVRGKLRLPGELRSPHPHHN